MSELKTFLNKLSYYNEEVIDKLNLDNVVLDRESGELHFVFSASYPLTVNEMDEITNALDNNILPSIKSQTYEFKFNNFTELEVSRYYDYIVKKLSRDDVSLLKAVSYKLTYKDKELTVDVPSSDISFSLNRIKISNLLKKYGFGDIRIKFNNIEENNNIEALINESRSEIIHESSKNITIVEYRMMDETRNELLGSIMDLSRLPNTPEEYSLFNSSQKTKTIVIRGDICFYDKENFTKNGKVKFIITDNKGHYATCTKTKDAKDFFAFFNDLTPRKYCEIQCIPDSFSGSIFYKIVNMRYRTDTIPITTRVDDAPVKRVELHLHTKMSPLDGVNDMQEYCEACEIFGHKALAVTDHNTVQSFHDLHEYSFDDPNFKRLYGVEFNYVDEDKCFITRNDSDIYLKDAVYTVFDFETTGFSVNYERIIEVSAVKVQNSIVIDTFSELVNPHKEIHPTVVALTNIKNSDVKTARDREDVLKDFRKFIDGTILVAHNSEFDLGHLYNNFDELGIDYYDFPSIDTLILSKVLYPNHKRYTLDALCNLLGVTLTQHHRALDDATATADMFNVMLSACAEKGITKHNELNSLINKDERYKLLIPKHINLLVKTQKGLTNLYHIVSLASTTYFTSEPILTRKVLEEFRDGILVGSGCRNSHFFEIAFNKSPKDLVDLIDFYDYIELQPISSFTTYDNHMYEAKYYITDTMKRIIACANKHSIPVVATGDVHQVDPDDQIYRKILVATDPQKGSRSHYLKHEKNIPVEYFRTTNEMLEEFSFLGDAKAYEIVVTNTNMIADSCEAVKAFVNTPYPPADDFMAEHGIPSAEHYVKQEVMKKANEMYGDMLPGMVFDRIEKELDSILTFKFSTIYLISRLLVRKSLEDGYIVGSRGSVGSSFVAYLMDITEVNSLPPHYICPRCHYSTFKMNPEEKAKYGIRKDEEQFVNVLDNVLDGYDLPHAKCPICGENLKRDGHDIPFETFLGVKEDPKTPDIDLNFSGENQSQIHEYIRDLFGFTKAFRAGTVITSQGKTSYAIVRDYFEVENENRQKEGLDPIEHTKNEIEALSGQITGSKKTSSQHPGGIVVVPKDHEIYEVTPVQYPGDAKDKSWMTTHFEYHNFEKNLFKLDVLGQDDPTVLKYLMELVSKNPNNFPFKDARDIPVDDERIYALMGGTETMDVNPQDIMSTIGSYGISEFGTSFVRKLLEEARPKTFSDLLKVSGLSHGTDVWSGNAQALLRGEINKFPKMEFKGLIGCRDDIMIDLQNYGVPSLLSFNIMEFVRKGKPCATPKKWDKLVEELVPYNVPEWFIWSCGKIKYMFPKAHACAYTIMALRIAWFKIYRPIYFYSAVLSKKKDKFDINTLLSGIQENKDEVERMRSLDKDEQDSNTKDLLTAAELSLEMKVRGMKFYTVDLYKSEAHDFAISEDETALYIPFIAIDSLGDKLAEAIVKERNIAPFTTKRDFQDRTHCSKTIFNRLEELGVFKDMPDDNQLLFDF